MRVSLSKSKNQQLLCAKLGWREHFDVKELELLNVGRVDGLLRPYAVKGSRHNILEYDVSAFTTLQFYLSLMLDKEQFVGLVKDCISIFQGMRRHYLHIDRLLDSFEHIYIHLIEKKIYFSYIPVQERAGAFSEEAFFQNMIERTTCSTYPFALFEEEYRGFLRRPETFSLSGFEAFINAISAGGDPAPVPHTSEVMGGWPGPQIQPMHGKGFYIPTAVGPAAEPGQAVSRQSAARALPLDGEGTINMGAEGTIVLGAERTIALEALGTAEILARKARLIRQKTGEDIMITRTPFVIGREKGQADLILEDNLTIGRIHASIHLRGDGCLLKDHGSINKSYLDGAVLKPEQEYPLKDGAMIRLSDEDFLFKIGEKA